MKVDEMLDGVRDAVTVRRVYGDPIEKDGITVIPVARVQGGAGGGGGHGPDGQGEGSGGGFGINARPVGAYVIKDGAVTWQPAMDLNRVILGGQVVGIVALLTFRSLLKARSKRKRAQAKAKD